MSFAEFLEALARVADERFRSIAAPSTASTTATADASQSAFPALASPRAEPAAATAEDDESSDNKAEQLPSGPDSTTALELASRLQLLFQHMFESVHTFRAALSV